MFKEYLPYEDIYSKDRITENILKIKAQDLWSKGYTGKGIVVAVLDTGCNSSHPDLKNRIIGGYNFTDDSDGNISIYEDFVGHGTHVAGIIAASNNEDGIVGVAPDAYLLILKVLNKHAIGSVDSITKAIEYAIDWTGPNNEKVNIISLSLGTKTNHKQLHKSIKKAISKDISVVVSAGNDGDGDISTEEKSYPAAYQEVISVGAVDSLNQLAKFSNTNNNVDLYAPGLEIESTYLNNGFVSLSGTSMAAPHVTGALALLINKYKDLLGVNPKEEDLFQYLMEHTIQIPVSNSGIISVLDLSKKVDFELINKELLIKCYCEARKTQAFFTQCLDECASIKDRDFLASLIQESAKTSNKLKGICEGLY